MVFWGGCGTASAWPPAKVTAKVLARSTAYVPPRLSRLAGVTSPASGSVPTYIDTVDRCNQTRPSLAQPAPGSHGSSEPAAWPKVVDMSVVKWVVPRGP